jgi:hypothetical protein
MHRRRDLLAEARAERQGLLGCLLAAARRPMDLTAQAGLVLVAETMMALDLEAVVQAHLRVRQRRRGFSEYDKLQSIVLLLAAGGECVEDVRVLRADAALWRLLERKVPSADALGTFLFSFHDGETMKRRPEEGAWIPDENAALVSLAHVQRDLVRRAVATRCPTRATLDLDATIIESHKRDAKAHYKGGRGYQPTAVLWAEEDLAVADQYRDGNVPAGMDPLAAAKRGYETLPPSVTQRFFRGDSACYEEKMLKWLWREKIGFTISADMSRELRRVCSARGVSWKPFEDRATETVALAEVEFAPGNWPRDAPPMRYVALRFSGKQGRLFSDGDDTKYLAVVSNQRDPSSAALVKWHWEKAGTIEHLHDVTKNDLGARVPPSGRFGANAAWYRLNLITYNVLTVLRRRALPERLVDARPRRLRFEVFHVAATLHQHARRLTAKLGAPPITVEELVSARGRLRDLRAATRKVLDGKSA